MNSITYEKVEKVINRHDPLGLLKMGAPKDEYEPEITELVNRSNNQSNLDWQDITKVFESWFYPGCISPELARKIEQELI